MVIWRKMLVLIALGLIPSQIQCLMTCVMPAQAAGGCHHHRSHQEKQTPAPCAVGFTAGTLIAHAPDQGIATPVPIRLGSQPAAAANKRALPGRVAVSEFLPPGSLPVLKI
ncbi:MAG TPA: hypothetical protein VGF16_01625 [Bryobacteraceae bacterium]|jgi:hypothetical protein